MGLEFTSAKDAQAYIEKQVQVQWNKTFERLNRIGLQFVIDARTKTRNLLFVTNMHRPAGGVDMNVNQGFFDQTGQLRASIGFIISFNGQIVMSDFTTSGVNNNAKEDLREEGKKAGEEFADSLITGEKGFSLICVAGANYAHYVESKGYDVITGSSLTAEQELKKWFQ